MMQVFTLAAMGKSMTIDNNKTVVVKSNQLLHIVCVLKSADELTDGLLYKLVSYPKSFKIKNITAIDTTRCAKSAINCLKPQDMFLTERISCLEYIYPTQQRMVMCAFVQCLLGLCQPKFRDKCCRSIRWIWAKLDRYSAYEYATSCRIVCCKCWCYSIQRRDKCQRATLV